MSIPVALSVLCLVCTAILVFAEVKHIVPLKVVSKTIAALAFVLAGLAGGLWDKPHGLWGVAALILCMGGDLFLLSRDNKMFLAGLVSFLLGHVAYVGVFATLGLGPEGLVAAPIIAAIAWFVWKWLSPHTGKLTRPVVAYIVVISTMVVASAMSVAHTPEPARHVLGIAAVLFFVSDLCVARDRFVAPGPSNRMIGLPLYFGAQVLFALAMAAA